MSDNRRSRRDFIKDIGRILFLGAFVTGASVLVSKPSVKGEKCVSDGICGRCSTLSDCALPQALSARQGIARNRK